MTTFQLYAAAGFGDDVLPILPYDAPVHADSAHLKPSRGKVPGRKRAGCWVGFRDWTRYSSTDDDMTIWQDWGAGIGMQGRRFPGLDIDVDDPQLADAIHREAVMTLGAAPARFGRGSRRLLVYAGAGLRKERLAFRRIGDATDQAVELLATGQQYVVEGIHPKTGQPYRWQDGCSPVELGPDGLTPITADQLRTFYQRIEGLLAPYGYGLVARSAMMGGRSVTLASQDGLRAPSMAAVGRALAAIPNEVDYDTWLKIGAAVKASAEPGDESEAFALWEDWSLQYGGNTPEVVHAKWESLRPPFRVGWGFLQQFATNEGDGTFYGAAEEFDAIAGAIDPSPGASATSALPALFERYVWVENLGQVMDLRTGVLLNREQFNVRNRHIGAPTSTKACAWAVLTSSIKHLQTASALTYRPGAPQFVDESLPGLTGCCVNSWRPSDAPIPAVAAPQDVQRWLDHVAFVIPDERERETVLNWLAWIIQHPGQKPNWALVIGSTAEGLGKDLLLDPVRVALGQSNIREIGPEDLANDFTGYLQGTRLLVVEEMQMHDRRVMMNRLKPLVAAPPYTLRVNIKFRPQYEIPNLLAVIFFTNMIDGLAISSKDRRYFVTWNDASPKPPEYYRSLVEWYEAGGAAAAARWLLQRDVSAFNPKGRAPDSAAKSDMRVAALSDLDASIHEALQNHDGPFGARMFSIPEIAGWLWDTGLLARSPSHRKIGSALKAAGVIKFDRRFSLGPVPSGCSRPHGFSPKQVQLFAHPNDEASLELSDDLGSLREAFWNDRRIEDPFDSDAPEVDQ